MDRIVEVVVEVFSTHATTITHNIVIIAQANGQAKANNKILIDIVKKNLKENLKRLHETLQKGMWAWRNTLAKPTGCTPFRLTYRHDAVFFVGD